MLSRGSDDEAGEQARLRSFRGSAPVLARCRLCRPACACCTPAPAQAPQAGVQRPNPASQHCIQQRGSLRIERQPDGDQYGVCVFEDNRQCEEWALLRGQCQPDGVRVAGYATAAGRYCAITGGTYAVVANSGRSDEQGTCTLPGGKVCDADAYHRGTCRAQSGTLTPVPDRVSSSGRATPCRLVARGAGV